MTYKNYMKFKKALSKDSKCQILYRSSNTLVFLFQLCHNIRFLSLDINNNNNSLQIYTTINIVKGYPKLTIIRFFCNVFIRMDNKNKYSSCEIMLTLHQQSNDGINVIICYIDFVYNILN